MQCNLNLLIQEFVERKTNNPRYSERAFAKSIGVSPGFLKLFFQGKRFLSAKRAKIIADRLGWSEVEADELISAVVKKKNPTITSLPSERFAEISDWYHFAIIEILKVKKNLTPDQIAKYLNISPTEVNFSLSLLCKYGLVNLVDGKYLPEQNYIVPAASSSAIRKFHRQCLEKAIEAVDAQSKEERELRSLTLAFDSSRKEEASAYIKNFVSKFEAKFGSGNLDKVYQLTLAFYGLDRGKQ